MGEPSEKDGSFSVPAEQPTRHFTDAEVRRNYEYILTSPNLYPPELHSAVRSVLSEPPLNPDWSDKGRQIAALFTPYGDREYQGDFLYRNLASWLAARGAEVAYIEVNQNRHLQLLLNIYEAAPDGEHYTIDGIDCYLTNEPDKAYQFIIYDCGVMQTPTSIFRDADHRLLCGSVLPYEIPVFHKALSECGSLEVRPVAICVPQEIQEYCMELFGENVQIAAASHDLFAKRVNGQIYRPLVEKYIAGEKRL